MAQYYNPWTDKTVTGNMPQSTVTSTATTATSGYSNPWTNTSPTDSQSTATVAPPAISEPVGPLGAFAAGVNRAIGPIPRGIIQTVLPKSAESAHRELMRQEIQERTDYNRATITNPVSSRVGLGTAIMMGAMATPAPSRAAGSIISTGSSLLGKLTGVPGIAPGAILGTGTRAAIAGGTGAALGASSYTLPGESNVVPTLLGGALGAGGSIAGDIVESTAKGLTKLGAKENIIRNIRTEPTALNRSEQLARKYDTFFTPGEASGSPIQLAREAVVEVAPDQAETIVKNLTQRSNVIGSKAHKLVRQVLPEGYDVSVQKNNQLFEQIAPKTLSDDVTKSLYSNAVLKESLEEGLKSKDVAISATAPNSIGRLEELRKYIKTQESTAVPGSQRADQLYKARQTLVNAISKADPEYSTWLKQAQKIKIHESLTNKIASATPEGTQTSVDLTNFTPSQFFNRLVKGKNYQEFITDMADAGIDKVAAQDMADITRRLASSKLLKAAEKAPGDFLSRSKVRNTNVLDIVGGFLKGNYNAGLARILTDKKFSQSISQIAREKQALTDRELISRAANLFSRATILNIAPTLKEQED